MGDLYEVHLKKLFPYSENNPLDMQETRNYIIDNCIRRRDFKGDLIAQVEIDRIFTPYMFYIIIAIKV